MLCTGPHTSILGLQYVDLVEMLAVVML